MVHVYTAPRLAASVKPFEGPSTSWVDSIARVRDEGVLRIREARALTCPCMCFLSLVLGFPVSHFESVAFDVGVCWYDFSRFQAELSLAVGHHQSSEEGYHSMDGVSPSNQVAGLDRNQP